MERVYVYGGRINQGGPQDISGFGARQQVTHVTRRVYVRKESRNELPTLDPFVTQRNFFQDHDYPSMFPTMETSMITGHRLYGSDSPSSPPSKVDSHMRTSGYYGNDSPSAFPPMVTQPYYGHESSAYPAKHGPARGNSPSSPPSKVDSHMRTSGYYGNDSPSAFPPMVTQPYYGHESSAYPAKHGPARGNPINQDANFHMMPQEAYPPPGVPLSGCPAPYGGPPYGGPQMAPPPPSPPPVWPQQPASANYQIGGGKYNPQIQGGVNNNGGDVVLGPKMNDRNKFSID